MTDDPQKSPEDRTWGNPDGHPECHGRCQGGGGEHESDCPASFTQHRPDVCPKSERVDDPTAHTWGFDGDDPYVVCVFCGQRRDISGHVVDAASVTPNPKRDPRGSCTPEHVDPPGSRSHTQSTLRDPDLSGTCADCDNPLANGGHANCQIHLREQVQRLEAAIDVDHAIQERNAELNEQVQRLTTDLRFCHDQLDWLDRKGRIVPNGGGESFNEDTRRELDRIEKELTR